MNGIFEIWSKIMPERAMACGFNREYLLVGGKDGRGATAPVFGAGLAVQPVDGQERLSPMLTSMHQIGIDSGVPGRFRGGVGIEMGGMFTDAQNAVMSSCCDRARSITWGIAVVFRRFRPESG